MADYCFCGESANNNALPYGENNFGGVMRRKVDLPFLVANPGKLALIATPNTPLSSFSGFVQNDTLELFQCPIGFLPLAAALRVNTVEGATAACTIGINDKFSASSADADGLLVGGNLNSAASACSGPTATAALSADAYQSAALSALQVADEEGAAVTMTFSTNETYATAIFDVAVHGVMMLPESMER